MGMLSETKTRNKGCHQLSLSALKRHLNKRLAEPSRNDPKIMKTRKTRNRDLTKEKKPKSFSLISLLSLF
jgi:hypothetical protein